MLNRIAIPRKGDGIDLGLLIGEPGQHIIRKEHIAAEPCGGFLLPGFCTALAGAPPRRRRRRVVAARDLLAVFIVCGAKFDQGCLSRFLVALLVWDAGGDPFWKPGPVRVFTVENGIEVALFGLQVAC